MDCGSRFYLGEGLTALEKKNSEVSQPEHFSNAENSSYKHDCRVPVFPEAVEMERCDKGGNAWFFWLVRFCVLSLALEPQNCGFSAQTHSYPGRVPQSMESPEVTDWHSQ